MTNKTMGLYKQIMKHNPEAIDKIESLEEAKDIIKMIIGNVYLHGEVYHNIVEKEEEKENSRYMRSIAGDRLMVCLDVQRYLEEKYNIDFVTSRIKIFPLARKLQRYENEHLVTIKQFSEDLYKEYLKQDF